MKKLIYFSFLLLFSIKVIAQSVTIDPQSTSSGIINVQSTNKGVLIPNMTTVQREAISSAQKGLLVFDTNTNTFWYHNGVAWSELINNGTSYWTPTNGNTALFSNYSNFTLGGGTNITNAANDGTLRIFSPSSSSNPLYLNLDATSIQARRQNVLTSVKTEMPFKINPFGGNVGIGTSTPNATLDVNGHTMSGTFLATSARNTHTQGAYLEWNKDGNTGMTYLLNQRGSGLGGFVIGEIDNANSITERLKINNAGALQINGAVAHKSIAVTLTSGVSYESFSTFNTSYLIINVPQYSTGINLQDGFAIGQQLIVQVKTSLTYFLQAPLYLPDNPSLTNINLNNDTGMGNNSILTLIWDGTDWQEVSHSYNN
jgi:hypothetical protein